MQRQSIVGGGVGNVVNFHRIGFRPIAWRWALALAVTVATFGACVEATQAAVIDWSSTAATTSWNTGSNWVFGTAPADSLITDIARFNQTSYVNVPTVNADRSINGIQIGDGTTATGPLTISNNNLLYIGSGGITMNANAGPSSLGQYVALGDNQTWTNNSSNALTMPTMIFNELGTGLMTLTLAGSGSGGIAFGNGWGGGSISGRFGCSGVAGSGTTGPAGGSVLMPQSQSRISSIHTPRASRGMSSRSRKSCRRWSR
jgi:hypothetical protein